MQVRSQNLLQKLQSNEIKWYEDMRTIIVFAISLFIFAVSTYSTYAIGRKIKQISTDFNTPDDLESLETCYVVNIVIVFISLLFLFYFLYKSIPFNSPYIYYLTSSGAVFIFTLLLVALSSYNINALGSVSESSLINSVSIINIVILIISCLAVCYIAFYTFEIQKKFKSSNQKPVPASGQKLKVQ